MNIQWWYALLSVLGISALSFIGVLTLAFGHRHLHSLVFHLIGFATGALLGNVFFHLLPTAIALHMPPLTIGFCVVSGILIFFVLEKFLRLQNHRHQINGIQPFGIINLFGDALHNFIDGIAIGTSYLVSLPLGISTTIAIALHEIPQELSDFGILLHAGFSIKQAVLYNFFSALSALAGTISIFLLYATFNQFITYLIPFTAGGFIYIAASNLIPELHKEKNIWHSAAQIVLVLCGIFVMLGLAIIN